MFRSVIRTAGGREALDLYRQHRETIDVVLPDVPQTRQSTHRPSASSHDRQTSPTTIRNKRCQRNRKRSSTRDGRTKIGTSGTP
jgi:hypothetical protein